MKDLINQKLLQAKQKKKLNLSLLQRYFKIYFKIGLEEESLKKRLNLKS
jgi:hypothetical protein